MKSLLKEKFRIQGFDSLARSLEFEGHPILKRGWFSRLNSVYSLKLRLGL